MDKNIEEILELIWVMKEKGEAVTAGRIAADCKVEGAGDYLDEMVKEKFIERKGDDIVLTPAGEKAGEGVVRRCRLAEWLLSNVLELDREAWEESACEFEHILSAEVTDRICTFLGHPPACPHGEPIPRGNCCLKFSKEVKPLVMSLTELRPGEEGRVVFMTPKHKDRLNRLGALGLVPGAVVRLHQKQPTYVLDIGETSIAVDAAIAGEIFVKKADKL